MRYELIVIVPIGFTLVTVLIDMFVQKRKGQKIQAQVRPIVKKCPVCKSTDLEYGRLTQANTTITVKTKMRHRATISLTCKSCGFVMLFADVKSTETLSKEN